MENKNKGSELLNAARDIVFAAQIEGHDEDLQRAIERMSQAISDGGYMVDSPEPEKENSMSDLPRGNLSNDDPHEFGAGIEITPQAKYWRDRSQVWMHRAIELGWDAEKQAKRKTEFVNVKPVIVSDAPDAHQVWLDVGSQHFTIGEYCETKEPTP